MALSPREVAGRFLYGALFIVALPLGLVAWARAIDEVVTLPVYRSGWAGAGLILLGLSLMFSAFFRLWKDGGGLPMNAYPPPRFVDRGVYGILSHPIYIGFVIVCAGASFWFGSASGLWFITPTMALASMALVVGYEGPNLRERFGSRLRVPLLHIPRNSPAVPDPGDRLSVYLLVFLPWVVAYEAIQFMGVPTDAVSSLLPVESGWPVVEGSTAVYSSVYALVLLVPFVATSAGVLRRFSLSAWVATVLVTTIYLTVPFIAPPRAFEPTTLWGRLLALEQGFNSTVASFPAFHVLWAFLAAAAWPRRFRVPAYLWAVAISVSCVTTGMHSVADIGAAVLLFPFLHRYDVVWNALRMASEGVANSWREWRFGPVRFLNHGVFGGLSMAVGILIVGLVVGPAFYPGGAIVALAGILGAAAWAQQLEGSPMLLRPFGYFGGLIGASIGVSVSHWLTGSGWILLGGFAVAAPWVQAIGRVRCLIQGCCHGGPASPGVGIRYFHSRSRVTRLSDHGGVAIFPAPLFSILGNVLIGVWLLRLWSLGVPPTFVAGCYLIWSGLARFVEESFRAEPQTKLVGPLHIYHWMALGSLLCGAVLSGVDSAPPHLWIDYPGGEVWAVSLGMGLVATLIMGVDFPRSNRRFSRLADVEGTPRLLPTDEVRKSRRE